MVSLCCHGERTNNPRQKRARNIPCFSYGPLQVFPLPLSLRLVTSIQQPAKRTPCDCHFFMYHKPSQLLPIKAIPQQYLPNKPEPP